MKVKKTSSKRSVTYVRANGSTVVMHKQTNPLVSVEVSIPFSEWKSDGKSHSPLGPIEDGMWKRIVKATKKGTAILQGPNATRDAAVASVTPLRFSILCPITNKTMKIPARGPACKHLQCFDLSCFLALQTTDGSSKCHICKATIGKDEKLVIDG
ncbi:sumo ligase, partial [Aphelenchoides avenae]